LTARWVDTPLDRPRWRGTLVRRLHRRLQAGVEVNPAVGEIGPQATLFLLLEGERHPGLFAGTSSDRIGAPEGEQAYYLTATKYLDRLRVAPYASLHYSEWDSEWKMPFGVAADLGRGIVVRPMYDGERTHLTAGVTRGRVTVTGLWVWLERAGLSLTGTF
jgi:hypothetical protein